MLRCTINLLQNNEDKTWLCNLLSNKRKTVKTPPFYQQCNRCRINEKLSSDLHSISNATCCRIKEKLSRHLHSLIKVQIRNICHQMSNLMLYFTTEAFFYGLDAAIHSTRKKSKTSFLELENVLSRAQRRFSSGIKFVVSCKTKAKC